VDSPVNLLPYEITYDVSDLTKDKRMNNRINLKIYAYEPDFAPEDKQVIQVLWGMQAEGWDYWKNLDSKSYKTEKSKLAEQVKQKIEAAYKGKLILFDTWTPGTYHRYCNA
jgi:phytoene dehydrogenase-like protein